MTTRVTEGARRERQWRCFFLVGLIVGPSLDACARVHSPELNLKKKERLPAAYCSHEEAATTRQALKIPLSFLFDAFTFSTLRILTLAEFVCTGIKSIRSLRLPRNVQR